MDLMQRAATVWRRAMAQVDRLVPPRLRTANHEGAKALVYVRAWVATVAFALSMVVMEALEGLPGQVLLNGAIVVLGPYILWRLRRGEDLDASIRFTLALAGLFYALGSLAQSPFDGSSVFFLVVIPTLAGFFFGGRQAAGWMVYTLVMGLVAMNLGLHGYTLPQRDPDPTLTMMVNFTFLMVLVVLAGIGIHDLKDKAFQRLDAASRAKSAFLANMSHEIRTPMNGVLGLTDLMLSEPLPPIQRERLELIKRSGDLLVSLVNQVLDLARIEAGKLELDLAPLDLRELVRDVRELYLPVASQKGLGLETDVDPGLPPAVLADPKLLRQVLYNLVTNALKFTEAGQVRVTATRGLGADQIAFGVVDTGIGIDPQVLPRLFSAFEQADLSTTRRHGGSGLGLAISRRAVELMGGHLEVRTAPGQGSTFFFTLTLPAADLPPRRVSTGSLPRQGGKVLVVDDTPLNLRVASALVQKAGYAVAVAANGREALEVFETEHFDVVLMDCHMPDMDGFEATRRLRASPGHGPEVPIIAVSASSLPEDQARCAAAGMDAFLAKPINLEKLAETLAHCRRRRDPRRATG